MTDRTMLLQTWVTIGSAGPAVTQDVGDWIDASGFADCAFWIDVTNVTPPGGTNTNAVGLVFETSPSTDESYFTPCAGQINLGTALPFLLPAATPFVRTSVQSTQTVSLSRYVRWRLTGRRWRVEPDGHPDDGAPPDPGTGDAGTSSAAPDPGDDTGGGGGEAPSFGPGSHSIHLAPHGEGGGLDPEGYGEQGNYADNQLGWLMGSGGGIADDRGGNNPRFDPSNMPDPDNSGPNNPRNDVYKPDPEATGPGNPHSFVGKASFRARYNVAVRNMQIARTVRSVRVSTK